MNNDSKLSFFETLSKINEGDSIESPGAHVLQKGFDLNHAVLSDSEEADEFDDSNDVFKELRKRCRLDPVYNSENEFSEQFEDENVGSNCDEDDDDDDDDDDDANCSGENKEGDEFEDGDEALHARMSHEAFNGKKRKHDVIITDASPVSAYDPIRDVLDSSGGISILNHLHGKSGFSKRMYPVEKSMSIQALLRKADWEKERNDLAPTRLLGSSIVGPIASEFETRRECEEEFSPSIYDNRVVGAQEQDDARLSELKEPLKVKKPRHPGKGRRKIEMKRLEEKSKRLVTFVKRRDGLFKKTQALCTMCGVQATVLTFSEAQNAYVFGNPSVNSVVERYLTETSVADTAVNKCYNNEQVKEIKDKYAEALVRLEEEKRRGLILDKVLALAEGGEPTEDLGSDEVELIRALMKEVVHKESSWVGGFNN